MDKLNCKLDLLHKDFPEITVFNKPFTKDMQEILKIETDKIIREDKFNKLAIEINYITRCLIEQTYGPDILRQLVKQMLLGDVYQINDEFYIYDRKLEELFNYKNYIHKISDNINKIDYEFINNFTDLELQNFTGVAMFVPDNIEYYEPKTIL